MERLDPGTPVPDRPLPRLALPAGDLWVFGYGSLMWRPGFPYREALRARLHGYRRALCVWSWVHRGTQQAPGLVLGLDRGGSCVGRAFRAAEADAAIVAEYLFRREMATPVYMPILRRVALEDGRTATALAFTVDRSHPQYAGRLSAAEAVPVVRRARGISGPNDEYVANTVRHLDELGIRDDLLHRIGLLLQSPDG